MANGEFIILYLKNQNFEQYDIAHPSIYLLSGKEETKLETKEAKLHKVEWVI